MSTEPPSRVVSGARKHLPLIATIVVIGVNAAANIVPINGYSTGALSDLNPTGFTPAGWVFSIWSVIYLGLAAFSLFQSFGSEADIKHGEQITTLYVLSAVANISWIFSWHYRQVELSFVVMLALLGSLIAIYRKLRTSHSVGWKQKLLVDAPFRLYLGWITTAVIANLGAVFFSQQFYPFGLEMDQWAVVSVATALAIYVWIGVVTRDAIYSSVFIWASLGIFYRPSGVTEPVRLVAITGTFITLALVLWIFGSKSPAREPSALGRKLPQPATDRLIVRPCRGVAECLGFHAHQGTRLALRVVLLPDRPAHSRSP